MAGIQVRESRKGTALVVTPRGRLDARTAGGFQELLSAWIAKGEKAILLDCSDLTSASGAGLRCLLVAAKQLQEGSGRLAICGLRENVASVFRDSQFDAVIRTFPDERAALVSDR